MGESHIIAKRSVLLGANCAISWNTQIMDTDFHKIIDCENNLINEDLPVIVGNHVWIGSHVNALKGSQIPDDCIIAAGCIITSSANKIIESDTVIGGFPNRIIRNNVSWRM